MQRGRATHPISSVVWRNPQQGRAKISASPMRLTTVWHLRRAIRPHHRGTLWVCSRIVWLILALMLWVATEALAAADQLQVEQSTPAEGSPLASAGPITFLTTLRVSTGRLFLMNITNPAGMSMASASGRENDFSLNELLDIGYGITPDLQVFAALPWFVYKSVSEVTATGHATKLATEGLGDALLFGRYTIFRAENDKFALDIAPIAGIKAPTVMSNTRFSAASAPFEPGSGAWDPLTGMTFVWQTIDWELDADAGYRVNTTAHDFRAGNAMFADMSVQRRIWPLQVSPGSAGFLYATLDSNFAGLAQNIAHKRADPGSGGTLWFLDPGIQYITAHFALKAAIQLPTVTALHGHALRPDYGAFPCIRVDL
jgi:hypothetical protein